MSMTYFKRYRMHFDLRGKLPDIPDVPLGYRFLPWRTELINAHADAKFQSFRNELDANVFPCLGQRDGCQSLMKEISNRAGFVPEATWLVVHHGGSRRPDNCGTVQGINDHAQIGSIQNLGIVSAHRGRGLGRALLIRALHGFRSIDLITASLEVTAKNRHAIQLYQRFGFKIVRTVFKSIEVVGV